MMIKYPIHKVAKDFKKGAKELPSKEILGIYQSMKAYGISKVERESLRVIIPI